MKITKQLVGISMLLVIFIAFTGLLLVKNLSEGIYAGLSVALLTCGLAIYFSDRIREIQLKKAVIKLYKKSQEGLAIDGVIIDISKILSKLSMASAGTASQRKEREALIDDLLKSAKTSKQEREKILENAKLITKLMATKDENELEKIRKEIEEKGLFD